VPESVAPRPTPLITPYWLLGLAGACLAGAAYEGQQALNRVAVARYGTVVVAPLADTVLARVGPVSLPYGVVASVVWGIGVAAMLVPCAVCLHELALLCVHPARIETRGLAFIVTGLIGWYCGTWVFHAIVMTVAYQLAVLPRP